MKQWSDISYRFATKEDSQKIYELALRAVSSMDIPRFAEDAGDDLFERINKGEKSVIIAEDTTINDNVIGYIEMEADSLLDGDAVFIREIYVLPEYRRGGIGKRMLEMMLKEITQNEKHIRVNAYTEDELKFWEFLGFKIRFYSLNYEHSKQKK